MLHTVQILFPFTVLPFLRAHLLNIWLSHVHLSWSQQWLTVISWCFVVFLPPKGHKSNRKIGMFVLAGEPCLYRSPHCVCLTDRLPFREWTSQSFSARSCFFSTRKSLFLAVFSWTLRLWDRIGVSLLRQGRSFNKMVKTRCLNMWINEEKMKERFFLAIYVFRFSKVKMKKSLKRGFGYCKRKKIFPKTPYCLLSCSSV